jgi:tetratricopeptide (TPR) repeat protein
MVFTFIKIVNPEAERISFSFNEVNISTRLFAWEMSRHAILEHPIFGVGMGNFQQYFEQNRGKVLGSAVGVFDDTHNLFLQIAATGGVLLLPIFYGYRAFQKKKDMLALAGICSVVIFCISAAFTPVSIPNFVALALVLSALLSLKAEPLTLGFPKPIRYLSLIFGCAMIYAGSAFIIAETVSFQAVLSYNSTDYIKAEKLSAVALRLNPTNQQYYEYNMASKIALSQMPLPEFEKEEKVLLALHPKAANSYSVLSTLNFLQFLGTKQTAYLQTSIDYEKKSLSIDPYAATRYVRLGYEEIFSGKLEQAKEDTKAGLSADMELFPGWIQLAKIYQLQDRKEQSIYALNSAYKLSPNLQDLKGLLKASKEAKDIRMVNIILPAEDYLE